MSYERYEIDLNAKCVCGCMEGNRLHKIYRFPNNYGASVVSGPKQRRMLSEAATYNPIDASRHVIGFAPRLIMGRKISRREAGSHIMANKTAKQAAIRKLSPKHTWAA